LTWIDWKNNVAVESSLVVKPTDAYGFVEAVEMDRKYAEKNLTIMTIGFELKQFLKEFVSMD